MRALKINLVSLQWHTVPFSIGREQKLTDTDLPAFMNALQLSLRH